MPEEFDLEMSRLCRSVESDGITVQVDIYRTAESEWTLEVVDEARNSIVWNDTFETDDLAYEAFKEAPMREGLASIVSADG